jgi:hypothetical protein
VNHGRAMEVLCGNISLSEGEKAGITITEVEIGEVRAQGGRCLVGQIWMERKVNNDAFIDVFTRVWRTMKGVIFKKLDDNIWLFEFEEVDDMRRVLDGQPWSFDRQILVLTEFDGKTPPAHMAFKHSPFWVQIHDMPLLCMTKGIAMKIGNSMGWLEEVDLAGDGAGWGRCLRICVEIDLTKPLERGRALRLDGKSYWVSFKYEKLPMFCFECGRLVHGEKGCPIPRNTRISSAEDMKQWEVRLRADDGRRRGSGVGSAYSTENWRKPRSTADGGADGGDWCAGSTNVESSDFSGILSHGPTQLHGERGKSVSGESIYPHNDTAGAVHGTSGRGDTVSSNNDHVDGKGEKTGTSQEALLEQTTGTQ